MGAVGKDTARFRFNGKENDNEVKGEGNSQDFGARIHDPRLGRFLSLDPIAGSFPSYSPYSFAEDEPIGSIDENGRNRQPRATTPAGRYNQGARNARNVQRNNYVNIPFTPAPFRVVRTTEIVPMNYVSQDWNRGLIVTRGPAHDGMPLSINNGSSSQ